MTSLSVRWVDMTSGGENSMGVGLARGPRAWDLVLEGRRDRGSALGVLDVSLKEFKGGKDIADGGRTIGNGEETEASAPETEVSLGKFRVRVSGGSGEVARQIGASSLDGSCWF